MYWSSSHGPQVRMAAPGARGWQALRGALLAAGVCCSVGFVVAGSHQGVGERRYDEVTVRSGDTLWSIAEQRYPDSDPRPRVEEIRRLNGLTEPLIQPGERIKVPAS